MKATTLKATIIRMGGTAEITKTTVRNSFGTHVRTALTGELNGYDVEMIGEESSFYTVRPFSKRDYYDPGSDYNPNGYTFCNRLKDLQIYCVNRVEA